MLRFDSLAPMVDLVERAMDWVVCCLPIPKLIKLYDQKNNPLVKLIHSYIDHVDKQIRLLVLNSSYARFELLIDING